MSALVLARSTRTWTALSRALERARPLAAVRRRLLELSLACALAFAPQFVAFSAAGAAEPEPERALRLDRLLERVRAGTAREQADEQERVRRFVANRGEQRRLLDTAIAERDALRARSEQLEKSFDENELRVGQREQQLRERQGNLQEIFGVVKQNAEELRGRVSESLVSAELGGRAEFLRALVQRREVEVPTIAELRRMWALYLEEIVETGQVSRFQASVSAANGANETREIVRVGAFNLVSDGRYLSYEFADDRIAEFPAQPAAYLVDTTSELLAARQGHVGFGIDPSRGQVLGTLVQVPSLLDRFHQGGLIGYAIALLGLAGGIQVVWRWIALQRTGRRVAAQTTSDVAAEDNPLGRVMAVYERSRTADTETLERQLDEAILKEVPAIERSLGAIKVISVIAPLMGLLGTVTGMINTFQAITLFGAGDPQVMAGGISQALVTTVLGLLVAIPLTLLYTLVSTRAQRIVHLLEEQAAGMIALRAQQRGGAAGS